MGKTKLATSLSKLLFNSDNAIIRFDMSEYSEKHSVSKLIGSPPGYQGHDEGGALTEAVRKRPYSVILFDEIEKADGEILNLFLQIADYGYLTDSSGKKISFRNTYIIMTSNIGGDFDKEKKPVGFMNDDLIENKINERLKKHFKEEFINRFDDIIVFNSLDENAIEAIVLQKLITLREIVKKRGVTLQFDATVPGAIVKLSENYRMGARPALRKVTTEIETPISDLLMDGEKNIIIKEENGTVKVSAQDFAMK